jgi:hypothetical protein
MTGKATPFYTSLHNLIEAADERHLLIAMQICAHNLKN